MLKRNALNATEGRSSNSIQCSPDTQSPDILYTRSTRYDTVEVAPMIRRLDSPTARSSASSCSRLNHSMRPSPTRTREEWKARFTYALDHVAQSRKSAGRSSPLEVAPQGRQTRCSFTLTETQENRAHRADRPGCLEPRIRRGSLRSERAPAGYPPTLQLRPRRSDAHINITILQREF